MKTSGTLARAAISALVALGFSLNAQADWQSVYSNDFNGGMSAQVSGGGFLKSVSGYAGVGQQGNQFSGQYLVNDTGCYNFRCNSLTAPSVPTTLTLTNLPAHTAISLSFLLAIRDSWDGSYYAPNPRMEFANHDYFNVSVDGVRLFSETFTTWPDANYVQSYVAPTGGLLTPIARNYDGNAYLDDAYDMGLDPRFQSIAHSGSTLTISFWADGSGWQGRTNGNPTCVSDNCSDESWGIDNLRVSILAAPVPEPESAAMMLAGLAVLGTLSRRRRAG